MEEVGRYSLREELGSGPHTVTYDATGDGQRVALKVVNEDEVPEEPEQKAGLAQALTGLKGIQHPSAVKVLDAGEAGGRLFVASEFMEVPTLAERLMEESSLTEQQTVLFIRQIAQALDKARDLGYCHGDLKPCNVYVVSEEKVKVADFAVKVLIEDPPARTQFQPPEEEEGEEELEEEWVTAEDLLRSKGRKATTYKLQEDFTGLAVVMMRMLGVEVPRQSEGQELDSYRDSLLRTSYPQVTEGGVSVHASEVIRRLLTAGGFDSPGEVVVELASAMLLGRSFGGPRAAQAQPEPSAASETEQVSASTDEDLLGLEELGLEAAEAEGEAAEAPAGEAPEQAGPVSAFFIWNDRRSGKFFVIREGEELMVGRDPDVSDVVVMDPAVSRRHCLLKRQGGTITIADENSSNGTFLNGQRVHNATVTPGDRIRMGSTRVYTFLPGEAD